MDISDCSFSELSYSKLFTTYINDFEKLRSFYSYNPLSKQEVQQKAERVSGFVDREKLIDALKDFHSKLGISAAQTDQVKKLSQNNALAVVTGQQLGMYGGPVFTIYKTLTAIALARKYEQELNIPVVPAFWMADEDHDFEEIAWSGILGRQDYIKVKLNQEGTNKPVAFEKLDGSLETFREAIKSEMFETDFSEKLWDLIDSHYQSGKSHGEAFAGFINELFAEEGLLIAGSNHKGLKNLVSDDLAKSISSADEVFEAIETKSAELESLLVGEIMIPAQHF